MKTGYAIIQVSALGRRNTGRLFSDKSTAAVNSDRLNEASTGERYEVEWFIGEPRDLAEIVS